eukprot:scaffold3834_cov179-Ochromonas_danica.AAC.10
MTASTDEPSPSPQRSNKLKKFGHVSHEDDYRWSMLLLKLAVIVNVIGISVVMGLIISNGHKVVY